ncbi:hypothetical protein [Streptomyces sp. Ru87]|nr:hypothetical protein [Streptomyces sp. Ru87]
MCSYCLFGSPRDLLHATGRRPGLTALYAELESVPGDLPPRLAQPP